MPAISATAPGKIILVGEHAVVYGQPAIAVPVAQVRAQAVVSANPRGNPGEVFIQAPDIAFEAWLADLGVDHPLGMAVRGVQKLLQLDHLPACSLRLSSTIPVAAGMGSSAAVSVAVIRALSAFLGSPLPDAQVSSLAYEIEVIHHGKPSGIDNTVVTYARPVVYQRGMPIQTLEVPVPFTLVIGDTGLAASTAMAVNDLARLWQADQVAYDPLFAEIGQIVQASRQAIASGQPELLGSLMNENHILLQQMQVSSPELDALVEAALRAGASGAKMSGGGRGGNMIALVEVELAEQVARSLVRAGAVGTLINQVSTPPRRQV